MVNRNRINVEKFQKSITKKLTVIKGGWSKKFDKQVSLKERGQI